MYKNESNKDLSSTNQDLNSTNKDTNCSNDIAADEYDPILNIDDIEL